MGRRSLEGEFGEFVRQLGASTRKDIASHIWTNPATMRVEKLDLYGVKVVTGVDRVDKTFPVPALRVYARKPSKEGQAKLESSPSSPTDLQELRDNLHILMMENVGQLDRLYRHQYGQPRNSQEALTAPLKVLADILGHPDLPEQLQAALALQERELPEPMSPVQLVHAAVRSLVRQGYRKRVTLKQLMLELHLLAQNSDGETSSTGSFQWREPRWVGRTLRAEKLVDPDAEDERRWLWGEQTRVVTLEPGFVSETLQAFDAQDVAYAPSVQGPLEFCLLRPCEECPYTGFCAMRPRKENR